MGKSVGCKERPLSSLMKQHIPPPPSFKKKSNAMKKRSSCPPSPPALVKKEVSEKEWEEEDERKENVTRGSKRKCSDTSENSELLPVKKSNQGTHKSNKERQQNNAQRWSSARYEQAEENMLKIMKRQGAVFGNPISRTSLRTEARKYIGDTGLLDHLLKHMDGKVAPGGCERFRRWHNSKGQMEYWLESADLLDIRKEAGIQDPFWLPPPGWKPGCSSSENSDFAVELKILKEELGKMKRDFQVLVTKKADEDLANRTPNSSMSNVGVNTEFLFSNTQSELTNWKEKIKMQLSEISGSLSSVQGACMNLEKWKGKIEHKLLDISISVSTLQTSRRSNTFSPSVPDNWDFFSNSVFTGTQSDDFASWLGGGELIDLQHTDYANIPWMEGLDFIKIEQDMNPHDPGLVSAPLSKPDHSSPEDRADQGDLETAKEEMSIMKRKLQDVLSKKDDEGQANTMSDSSVTDDSKLDLENSILMLQELYQNVVKMKADIEQQVKDITISLDGSEVSKQSSP